MDIFLFEFNDVENNGENKLFHYIERDVVIYGNYVYQQLSIDRYVNNNKIVRDLESFEDNEELQQQYMKDYLMRLNE